MFDRISSCLLIVAMLGSLPLRASTAGVGLTARVELALRGMIADYRLDALTYQFMAFGEDERTQTLPFVAASRLMAEGIGFGGEGDLIAAAATTFFNWLKPPASL